MALQPEMTPEQWKRLPIYARRRIRNLEEENKRQRASLGRVWGYILGGLLDERFGPEEEPVLTYILDNDPVLRQRFRSALRLDEPRVYTGHIGFPPEVEKVLEED